MTLFKAFVSGYPAGRGKIKLDSNISVTYFRILTVTQLSDWPMLLVFTAITFFFFLLQV